MAIEHSTHMLSRLEARVREKLQRRVGQIILNFSSIENALGLAFSLSKGQRAGGEEFYTGTNFPAKIRLIDALMLSELSVADLKKWVKIKNRLHKVARIRNHMAHLVLVNRVEKRVLTPMLQPAWFKPAQRNTKSYALKDVEEVSDEVDKARLEVWTFVRGIRGF